MRSYLILLCAVLFFVYFGYHFVLAHNTHTLTALETSYKEKSDMLVHLEKEEKQYKAKIRALQDHTLDPDIAEESIRYVLNKGRTNEEVILID